MNNLNTQAYLHQHEDYLKQLLAQATFPSMRLKDAMHYALFPGGKRFRPLLVYLAGELLQTNINCLNAIAASIELTHCYSLVHDDLPAMDDDDLRRGRPSCHRAFDEGTAILAGDALQIFAVETLLTELSKVLASEKILAVIHELTRASGPSGMISGQCLDLYELNQQQPNQDTLQQIHHLKTGQLLLACMNMVIAASDHPANAAAQSLQAFATHLGLAYQMHDDYLDAYATTDILGKGRASDKTNGKLTFATVYTKPELEDLIASTYQMAMQALAYFDEKASKLCQLTEALKRRQ